MVVPVIAALTLLTYVSACVTTPTTFPASGFSFGTNELEPLDPPFTTADATGTYNIGVRRESLSFGNRLLNVSWWYPATVGAGASPFVSTGGIVGEAFEDVPVDNSGGPYPLIVFSPGVASYDDAYYFFCQQLASSGYVVISIKHLDSTEAESGSANPAELALAPTYLAAGNPSYAVWLLFADWFRCSHFGLTYRSQETSFVLDQAIAASTDQGSPFYGSLDTDNIGMAGHSLGGFYTLLKGGMAINCDYPLTPAEANVNNPILTKVNICAWPEAQSMTNPTALQDPRIKAIIALAPPLFIKPSEISRGATAIDIPMMVITGNDSLLESTLEPQQQVYDAASGPKYLVEVDKTNHLLVTESYQQNDPGNAVPPFDKANFPEKAAVYMEYSTAFFDVYLKGDEDSKNILHDSSTPFLAGLEFSD